MLHVLGPKAVDMNLLVLPKEKNHWAAAVQLGGIMCLVPRQEPILIEKHKS